MKSWLINVFKGKKSGFYIALSSAVLILVFDILYIALDYGDKTFSVLTFALMLCGSIITIVYCFIGRGMLDFMPVVSCILYGFGFGQHLILALESLSDVWNQVNFVGGNAQMGAVFTALFFVPVAAAVVAAFMNEDKN